jgi:hypothetical protein
MYTKAESIKSSLFKKTSCAIMGMLLMGAALLMVSPSASAHQYQNFSWWYNSEYNLKFLQVDFHTVGVPFDMQHDSGFWMNDHHYCFYHRYFVYEGDGFHTYYLYTYRSMINPMMNPI